MTLSLSEFRARVKDHGAWFGIAETQKQAAELVWLKLTPLWDEIAARKAAAHEALAHEFQAIPLPVIQEHMRFGGCYLMLAGYAVEDFLKAISVRRIVQGGSCPSFIKGSPNHIPTDHKYENHAAAELGAVSPAEVDLLKRLSVGVRWGGRYPVPRSETSIDDVESHFVRPTDRDAINAFCDRLIAKYHTM